MVKHKTTENILMCKNVFLLFGTVMILMCSILVSCDLIPKTKHKNWDSTESLTTQAAITAVSSEQITTETLDTDSTENIDIVYAAFPDMFPWDVIPDIGTALYGAYLEEYLKTNPTDDIRIGLVVRSCYPDDDPWSFTYQGHTLKEYETVIAQRDKEVCDMVALLTKAGLSGAEVQADQRYIDAYKKWEEAIDFTRTIYQHFYYERSLSVIENFEAFEIQVLYDLLDPEVSDYLMDGNFLFAFSISIKNFDALLEYIATTNDAYIFCLAIEEEGFIYEKTS